MSFLFFGAIEDPTVESSIKYADKMGESAISGTIYFCQGIVFKRIWWTYREV